MGKRREGKEGERLTSHKFFLRIYVMFAKCQDQTRDLVTTCNSTKDSVRGKMCDNRSRAKLRRTEENLKIQTARHMWLQERLRLEQAKHH